MASHTRFVAFLRAINVGGHTVKMDRLRTLFEELGLERVSTFIASGNVIFESPMEAAALEDAIAEHLERSLGYAVDTFLRTGTELQAVAEHPPFTAEEVAAGRALYVCFLPERLETERQAEVEGVSTRSHVLRAHGRELYWLGHTPLSESDIKPGALERALGMPTTMRNLNTVRRILGRI